MTVDTTVSNDVAAIWTNANVFLYRFTRPRIKHEAKMPNGVGPLESISAIVSIDDDE